MSVTRFQTTLQPLLKHLNVDSSQLTQGNSYQITLENMTINLVSVTAEWLLIAVNLGAPLEGKEVAWQLLELNLFGEANPPLQISAVAENRNVMLWTQERLAYLEASALISLFERFFDNALRLRSWLREPASAAAEQPTTREQPAALNSLQQRLGTPPK